ncbi:MAG: hypothetical protein QW087_04840 [Methanomassiliicoccales archaeon]
MREKLVDRRTPHCSLFKGDRRIPQTYEARDAESMWSRGSSEALADRWYSAVLVVPVSSVFWRPEAEIRFVITIRYFVLLIHNPI